MLKNLLPVATAIFLFANGGQALEISSPAKIITLDEAYRLALAQSEKLAMQGETVTQLDARIDQFRSVFRPSANLILSQTWQDTPSADYASSAQTSKPQAYFAFHQSLFTGMRDTLALLGANRQTESARLSLQRAKEVFYQNVASAYTNLLSIHSEIFIRQEQIKITANRIEELKRRERIGRSRTSEVLAAEAQLAQNRSQLAGAFGRERAAQWLLRFLTGLDRDSLTVKPGVMEVGALDSYLSRAAERNDVEAARKDLSFASLQTDIQKKLRQPAINFDGDYYLLRPNGSSRHINWDIGLSLSLPLYTGGEIPSLIAQAQAAQRSSEKALQLALRQAELDVKTAYDNLASIKNIATALETAVSLAEANAKAQTADYAMGLVTNLDVLSSLNSVQDLKLQLEDARVAELMAGISLEVAAGGVKESK